MDDLEVYRNALKQHTGDVESTVKHFLAKIDNKTDKLKLKNSILQSLVYDRLTDFEVRVYRSLASKL